MVDFIIIAILVILVGAAVAYIVKAKKSGVKCIGCSAAGGCSHNNNSGCGCGCSGDNESKGESCCGCHTDTKE